MNAFYDFYRTDLRPVLTEQERSRKKLFSNIRICLLMGLVSTPLLFFYFKWIERLSFVEALTSSIIILILYLIIMYKAFMKSHRTEVKQNILSRVANFIDPSLDYRANARISNIDIVLSSFFERGMANEMTGEDFMSGHVHGLLFKCSEIYTPRFSTGFLEGDFTRTPIRFQRYRGLFAVIELPKVLNADCYILPNSIRGKVNRQFTSVARLERVKLEDPAFERYFNAYAADQVQSRTVLTTKLIDDITMLRQKVGSDIMLCILGNKLYISVSTSKDLFEPSVYKTYLNSEYTSESLKELNVIVHLVKDISEIFRSD